MGRKEERKELAVLEEILCELQSINAFLRFTKTFSITQEGAEMGTATGIKQGGTGVLTATPLPAGSSLSGVVPTWTTSDTTNSSLTPSTDGLKVSVAFGAGAVVGSSITFTVTAKSPDGTVTATGSLAVPVLAPTPSFPSSFDVNQTS